MLSQQPRSLQVKLNDAMNLLQAIQILQNTPAGRKIKFGYMLAYNRRILEAVQQDVQATLGDAASDALINAYDDDRIAALRAVARKDDNGEPVIENNAFVIDDQEKVVADVQRELEKKHGPAMQAIA